jgi:hypothetical protein
MQKKTTTNATSPAHAASGSSPLCPCGQPIEGHKEQLLRAAAPTPAPPRPRLVCLCGSTRFTREMMLKSWEFAKQGVIAIGWNVLPGDYCAEGHGAEAEGVKEQIDELHKRKIDLCDEVLVLNINGYIGESTRSELNYARATGKPVNYLEPIL